MLETISVTRYSNYIKQIFDAEELLHNIKIVGEVFGVSFSRQVTYFSLKDETSSISCVCFYPQLSRFIKEGESVVITGSPNYYTKSGKLNFNIVDIEPAGQGLLYQKFIEMKDKLEKEGLFDISHKKKMPSEIKRIGVITSKDGAVIRDIINVATRRNPSVDIVLFPTKVQGNGAEDEISLAIQKLDDYDNIDVIVVARGGGSLEDLWAFNSEKVARATYNCNKPIVSAVGHETDYTIIDFVSDLRAPTPSAAAELLTENMSEKKIDLSKKIERLQSLTSYYYKQKKSEILAYTSNLMGLSSTLIKYNKFKLDKLSMDFERKTENVFNNGLYELGLLENSLKNLSPLDILKRGYAKIEQNGKVVDKANDVVISSDVIINFQDGKVIAKPTKKEIKWNTKMQLRNLRTLLLS